MVKMKFKNYLEQIEHLTTNRVLFNNIVEVEGFHEEFYESLEMNYRPHLSEEEFEELFEEVFQYFVVSLSGSYTQEHVNAGIVFIESLNVYVLCVCHFGTAWEYVSPVNYIK